MFLWEKFYDEVFFNQKCNSWSKGMNLSATNCMLGPLANVHLKDIERYASSLLRKKHLLSDHTYYLF